MKAYLLITGALFGLLVVAHVWRAIAEWPALLHDSGQLVEAAIGIVAAALSIWAWRLLRRLPPAPK